MRSGRLLSLPLLGLFLFLFVEHALGAPRALSFGIINNHGICAGSKPPCALTQDDHSLARAAGFDWVRVWAYWNRIEPTRGVFKWEELDAQVSRARAAGLKVHLQPLWAPAWATCGKPSQEPFECMETIPSGNTRFADWKPHCAEACPPEIRAYKRFIGKLVARYPDAVAISAASEPADPIFWPSRADTAKHLFVPCYEAAKKVNPNILVVGPEEVNPGAFRRRLEAEAKSGRRYFDVLSLHLFDGDGGNYPNESLRRLDRKFLPAAKQFARGRPVWVTATGVKSDPEDEYSLENQSEALEEMFRELRKRPEISRVILFRLRSSCKTDAGILFCDGTPKPAFWKLAWVMGKVREKVVSDEY